MSKAADAAAAAASGAQVVTAAERARRAERAKRSAQLMAWGCDDHKITAPYRTDGNGVANDLYLHNGNLRFLMIGLDAAGKTTICYRLAKSTEVVTTIPTIGFNVETVRLPPSNPKAPGNELVLWDVGGRDKIRPLWRHYYADTHALIFVVDSNDTERLDDRHGDGHGAAQELHHAMDEPELWGKPVLLIANKQDLPMARSPAQVCEALCFPPEACHEAFGADVTGRPAIARDAIPLIRYLLLGDAAFHAALHAASHAADATKRHSPLTAAARAAAQAGPAGAAGADGWLPVAALVTLVVSYIPFATPYLRVIGSAASGADVESLHVGLEWLCDAVYRRAGLDAPRPRPSGGLLSNCTLM